MMNAEVVPHAPWVRRVSILLCIVLLAELLIPTAALAVTSGPSQPDFASFEPVATTNLVDPATGTLTYNLPVVQIPGPGGGYALSLSYHSGVRPNDDATWVGYGWTLNPGAINRAVQGIPDDFSGQNIISLNKGVDNKTYAAGFSVSTEAFSTDIIKLSVGYSKMVRFNNYYGMSFSEGLTANAFGGMALSYEADGHTGKFGISISPFALVSGIVQHNLDFEEAKAAENDPAVGPPTQAQSDRKAAYAASSRGLAAVTAPFSGYGVSLLTPQVLTTNTPQFSSKSYRIGIRALGAVIPFVPGGIGIAGGFEGSYTVQSPVATIVNKGYGLLYHGKTENLTGSAKDEVVYDYSTDRESPFTKRDRYLHSAFLTPDSYALSGESLAGSFQAHNRKVGVVHPAKRRSVSELLDMDYRVSVGTAIGLGGSGTSGSQVTEVRPWTDPSGYRFAAATDTSEAWYDGEHTFFRFVGDMGGYVKRSDNDLPHRIPATRSGVLFASAGLDTMINDGSRSGRSSNICYATNREMAAQASGGKFRRAYTASGMINQYVKRDESSIIDQIGEFTVINESGVIYTYGLPVYARNENNLAYGVADNNWGNATFTHPAKEQAYFEQASTVNGQRRLDPYASTYLLTQIVSSDYIDRTGDGPSSDDFGSYTVFNYRRTAGTYLKSPNSDSTYKWFRWRSPYTAQHYNPGRMIDNRLKGDLRDDRGLVSYGEKEVYVLESIKTKTHTALFVTNQAAIDVQTLSGSQTLTGSQRHRLDAYEAYNPLTKTSEKILEQVSSSDVSTIQPGYDGVWKGEFVGKKYNGVTMTPDKIQPKPNKNEYLEKIELWSTDNSGTLTELLQTVRFEYDYSTMMASTGKWYSVDTLTNDTTHHYSAPTDLNSAVGLTTKHLWPESEGSGVGLYRYGKLTLRRVWFEYGGVKSAMIAPYEFDYRYPLKSDFASHVRDRYPDVFSPYPDSYTSLDTSTGWNIDRENPSFDESSTDRWGYYAADGSSLREKYWPYVNQVPSSNFDPAAWNLKSIKLPSGGQILIQYEQTDYRYVQDQVATAMAPVTHLDEDDNEFIDVDLLKIGITPDKVDQYLSMLRGYLDNHKVYLRALYQFNNCVPYTDSTFPTKEPVDFISCYFRAGSVQSIGGTTVRIAITDDQKPHDAAVDYARANRAKDYDCDGKLTVDLGNTGDWKFWKAFVTGLLPGAQILRTLQTPPTTPIYAFSHLRLPILDKKLGGGIRVKRLLMYDKGLEAGDEVLYGTEYIYKKWEDVGGRPTLVSSGVAANEPSQGRDENALVQPLVQRSEQSLFDDLLYGADLDKFEGPLVGAFLPSPSITHSQVIVQSIHAGETNTGHMVSTFWTWREYPVTIKWTDVKTDQNTPLPSIDFLSSISTSKFYSSQGYSVVIPSMNGRPIATKSCKGRFSTSTNSAPDIVSSITYEYFEPGESLPVLDSGVFGGLTYLPLGREEQITIENRIVTDVYQSFTMNIDGGITIPSIFLFIPTPFLTGSFMVRINDKATAQNVTTKVITYPAVVRATIQEHRGIRQVSENIAFNPETGRPAITRTYDAFDDVDLQQSSSHNGSISTIDIPASSVYPSLGQVAANYRRSTLGVAYSKPVGPPFIFKLTFSSSPSEKHWPGDLVLARQGSTIKAVGHVTSISGNDLICSAVSWSATPASGSATVTVEVLKSGKKNFLLASAGSVVAYGLADDYFENSTGILNGLTGILSANASVYSDAFGYSPLEYGTVSGGPPIFPNVYEIGSKGRWTVQSTWVYSDSTISSTQGTERIYKNGGVAHDWYPFDWSQSSQDSRWILTDSVTQYDPFANVTESRNAVNVYSSVRYAHSNTLPSIIGLNARRDGIRFKSFEDQSGVDTTVAHTGRRSLKLADSSVAVAVDAVTASWPNSLTGLAIKTWVKSYVGGVLLAIGSVSKTPVEVSRSGDWRLVEARFTTSDLVGLSGTQQVTVKPVGTTLAWVDDVRILPLGSKGTCYAYDQGSQRLVAQFDESHFATIYQYDGQGRLVRLMKETERGIKTVKDGSYHQPLVARNDADADGAAAYFSVMRRFGDMGIKRARSAFDNKVREFMPTSDRNSGLEGQFDVLQIDLGLDSSRARVFGRRVDTLIPGLNLHRADSSTKKDARGQK